VILFGGFDASDTYVGDTWEWDGASWTERTPAIGPSPSPRYGAAMAYDPVHHYTILFGGYDQDAAMNAELRDDTWVWDGTSWTEQDVAVRPEARASHSLVFDRARRRVALFGSAGTFDFSPWEWDGVGWVHESPLTQPDVVQNLAATYDEARREIIFFGGLAEIGTANETWTGSYVGDVEEVCGSGLDLDGDGKRGCEDEDCTDVCTPACLGEDPCSDDPRCGDGMCGAVESDRLCPADCPAPPAICGDGYCTPGETCAADCP
jgi:hypothetical protein